MRTLYKYTAALILILALSASVGCAPTYVPPDYSSYYWPKEPLQTRVRLLHIISTDIDVRSMTEAESLFGNQSFFSFTKPHSIAVDNDGNMYVTDTYAKTVYVLNTETERISQLSKPGGWVMPVGLGIDNQNNLLAIADGDSVFLFNVKTGKITLSLGARERFVRPNGLALDPVNRYLYIGDTKDSKIYKYDYEGNRLGVLASFGHGPQDVYYPGSIAVDRQGRLYVADTMHWKIKIWDSKGNFVTSFGEHGSIPGQFNRPKGISVSKDGIIAVTDNDLNIFLLMNEQGLTYTYIGGVGSSPAKFAVPMGIYISDDDKIYVVDQVNRRIQIFQMYTDRYYRENPSSAPAKTSPAVANDADAQATGSAPETPEAGNQ